MKSGQCPKCASHEVFCNTNRKFPALNTMTLGVGKFGDRYAFLDTYICVSCGYAESYVAKAEDLNYVKEEWASVEVKGDRTSEDISDLSVERLSADHLPSNSDQNLDAEVSWLNSAPTIEEVEV